MTDDTTSNSTDHVSDDDYAGVAAELVEVPAPVLDYRPRNPVAYQPKIALVGAGGITRSHLSAYKAAGYDVAAICNRTLNRAEERAAEFFPTAHVTTDFDSVLADDNIAVLDIATHPDVRVQLIERALKAGKHVLSQKPFVLDLDAGTRLADLADARGVKLAVNQNGRWAPHFSYMREAVRAGLIGEVDSVHCAVHWNHGWIEGTPFEEIDDLVLSDFGIHWFDFLASVTGNRAKQVYATFAHTKAQTARPPLLSQVLVELEDGQASLVFDADTKFGALDSTFISGNSGALSSRGPDLGQQEVTLTRAEGVAYPTLEGAWFNDGFHGAMGELLCAIENNHTPLNNARDNLTGLAICFAAIHSARRGEPVDVGSVRAI